MVFYSKEIPRTHATSGKPAHGYITPLESSSELPQKAAPQPQLEHMRARSYSPHQSLPWYSEPCAQTLPYICVGTWADAGMGLPAGAALPRANAWLLPDSPLPAHVCCRLHYPPCPPAFLLLHKPPCADSHFFLVLCLSFLSVSLAQSLSQEIKDNPPFFCCRIPCLTFAACACTDSKRD